MFQKILIANRGEIACRIMRTARRMGISTVAIYSSADAGALHVRQADEARWVGPAPSAQSYLDITAIIAAARATGAQAIHPGYGFLSENAAFAEACKAAGIVFIGPDVEAIRVMGSKSEAKALMAGHGVPLVPGYYGAEQSDAVLLAAAREVGLPLLIKASAGGGGRGMRIVRDFLEFPAALASAQREARNAFGDPTVLLERYIENPRHIEVQVFGDSFGNVVHLYERDCSLQRRHQKVIEEAPAVHLTETQRAALFSAAIKAAHAVNYVGAGTVEFILDRAGGIYFIEMNTRLQVEHPVTERVTGQDLVAWQLRVAAGEPLPLSQSEIGCHGHAIEVRVYAEDPAQNFQPSTGRLEHLALPADSLHVRVDTGVVTGDSVTPYYDAMIAKIITDADSRADALQQMQRALAQTEIVGVTANIPYLQRILAHPEFQAGGFDTHFVEDQREALMPVVTATPPEVCLLLAAHAHAQTARALRRYHAPAPEAGSPWESLVGFRLNEDPRSIFQFRRGEESLILDLRQEGTSQVLSCTGHELRFDAVSCTGERVEVSSATSRLHGSVIATAREIHVFWAGTQYRFTPINLLDTGEDETETGGKLVAPMPGAVMAVLVEVGATVTRGTPVVVLEAMKIEHTLVAPFDGTVLEICYGVGEQVLSEGEELVKLQPTTEAMDA